MSLRGRLLLIFGGIVAITVALVSYAVSVGARRVFERLDEERTLAINGQFKKEFQLQGEILSGRTRAIASSQPIEWAIRNTPAPRGRDSSKRSTAA